MSDPKSKAEKAKTHHLSLKGSSKLVSDFFEYSINTILFQRGVYPAEDFTPVKKYGLNMLVSSDDQVKAYIKKIMGQLSKWMIGGKISKLVVVITSKETGEHVERWQFDVCLFSCQICWTIVLMLGTRFKYMAGSRRRRRRVLRSPPRKRTWKQSESHKPTVTFFMWNVFRSFAPCLLGAACFLRFCKHS